MATSPISSNPTADVLASLTRSAEVSSAQDEAQSKFLTLLTTQLKNQDPLNPLDNAQVTSQLAQISTVDGIERLNLTMGKLLDGLAGNETMQAAALVGRSVLVPGDHVDLGEGGARGGFHIESPAESVTVSIRDANGLEVAQLDLGALDAGTHSFAWDGNSQNGTPAAEGRYQITVTAQNSEGTVAATALERGTVTSVVRGSDGVSAEVGSLGMFSMSEIRQIL
ncbi:MAG: flagellar hook assembly protein FlgD [Rhodocyclaceae bacterium]|nr:flagellar hook assembly protein FlgD [Rhodocyclaceae bacterium]